MKILFVGMGGTNTYTARPLLRYFNTLDIPDKEVIFMDGDSYDIGNMNRQDFNPDHVSVNKAEAKVRELKQDFPNMLLTAVPEYLSEKSMDYYITNDMVVMVAVDCMKTRRLIDERAQQLENVLVISMGNELIDGDAFVYCRVNGKEITPSIQKGHPEISTAKEPTRSEMSCEQIAAMPSGGQLIFANAQSGIMGATMFWKFMVATEFLTKEAKVEYRGAYFDVDQMKVRPVTFN